MMVPRPYVLLMAALSITGGFLLAAAPAGPATSPAATATSAPATGAASNAATPQAVVLEPNTHDPAMIKAGDYYYVFYTGGNIMQLRSKDLIHWERGGNALPGLPNWVPQQLPNTRGLWAPDISFFNGTYHLYYAASAFGRNTSGIGLATNKSLDPTDKAYQWHDEGEVFSSAQGDTFNAIDPNLALDENGNPWLAFGSFWSGIKMRKLNKEGQLDPADKTLYSLAARKAPETAIEGAFIIHEAKYYYLFVSWDRCCRGLNSTYRVMVGRSEKITGPYLDKTGGDMREGAGTEFLAGDGKRIIGPGHCGLFKDGDHWLMVHHFYDGNTPNGTSRLQVRPVTFDDKQWPVVGKAINSPQ